ncbi:hypothetical protein SAMN05216251_108100 [Actinacidiphila alni]|uniref:Uncharacterized protein n=1 Tax=Actinacidiphila alni TaxID=380248 RepID=A0A1I2FWK2_9ACTN|nr:hypothetical protein SAMN05216251_108100 [Actinacidiphila alni]
MTAYWRTPGRRRAPVVRKADGPGDEEKPSSSPGPSRDTGRPYAARRYSNPSHICSISTDHQWSGEAIAAGSCAASCAWKSTVQRPA